MSIAIQATRAIGLTASFYLSGINFTSSHLTVPLLYGLPTAVSTQAFASLYYGGIVLVIPLTIVSTLASGTLAYLYPAQRVPYGVAAFAVFVTIPWTQIVMGGVNGRLLALSGSEVEREKVSKEEVGRLLASWRWMSMVRAALALMGGAVGLWTALEHAV